MQRIPSQADTSVLSSSRVESKWWNFGFCSVPVCCPFSDVLERKLWDRDTEISNCLITSSSESEDVHGSSSSPKLLTGSKRKPWVSGRARKNTERAWEKQKNMDNYSGSSSPKLERKNLKHVWNTNLSPNEENRQRRLRRITTDRWLNPGETTGTTLVNTTSPLVDPGSPADLLCCWNMLITGKRTVIHAYALCTALVNEDGKHALCLMGIINTHRAKPHFRKDMFATEILQKLPGFEETSIVCVRVCITQFILETFWCIC